MVVPGSKCGSLCSLSSEWIPDLKVLGKVRRREERRWARLICPAQDVAGLYTNHITAPTVNRLWDLYLYLFDVYL